ncbi:glycosyltransferase family 4 protein [Ferruginibacter paludis]|uniref:glycosyltransferase family 4 protein n=1 Tax=Ferruginibacter paludis TaxID=1310417 RepID=UPI0025B594B4|nr:glycosyltransferase family 4 protein [Ferruginibacter paludis]MDN3657628.1 glycosyltransferase family 4 protein [Ferruginibacter paludis]
MKLLLVNWSWYATGGDWTYIENIHKLYEKHGYEVIPFSTHNKKNTFSPYSKYFVSAYDFKELNKHKTISNGIKALRTSVVSSDALNKLDRILEKHDIKFAHLHNIHHYITPAIVEKLHKKGIKIIWTLHDYKIICPENSFVSKGKVCEKCMDGSFYHCAINKCKKNSLLASALATFEAYYYHKKNTYHLVDFYLCPSRFILNKFLQFGFDKNKMLLSGLCYDISLVDNFIERSKSAPTPPNTGKYILYVGRLEDIKGVKTLIEAVRGTDIHLKIAGRGNAEESLTNYIQTEHISNVELLGFKKKDDIFELTQHASFGVCPSEWYENYPFSVSETFLFSKPVVGANIGGIPELVINEQTGLLFEAGNQSQLREKLLRLWNDDELVKKLGEQARKHSYDLFNYETHWNTINSVIQKLDLKADLISA